MSIVNFALQVNSEFLKGKHQKKFKINRVILVRPSIHKNSQSLNSITRIPEHPLSKILKFV